VERRTFAVANVSSLTAKGLNFFFQSKRANIDGKVVSQLVKFIEGAKHSLDVAIYDMKNPDVLKALKQMSSKVQLHILYDAGTGSKVGPGSTTVDPKSSQSTTEQAIIAAGLKKFAHPVQEKGSHLMHDKFIVKDGASVWSGSGNFTNGGLLLQDNNFFTIDAPAMAAAYSKTFGDLGGPGHTLSHAKGVQSPPTTVKVGGVNITVFFSTQFVEGEGIEAEVQKRLKGAKKVRVIAMLISDKGILSSLLALKKKDIKGVVDPHEMKQVMKKKANDPNFWFANGDPRFVAAPSHAFSKNDQNDFMHNKVMIIDDKVVITGSYNFSENAELNDENMLVIESPAIAGAYDKYFNALFAQYQKHGAKLPPA
jgi:phosphatidylserine/phosphatidylglycerophosphate/cardiolipin synthase-like enzyme